MVGHLTRAAWGWIIGSALLCLAAAPAEAEGGPFNSPARFFYDQQQLQLQQHQNAPRASPRPRTAAPGAGRSPVPKTASAPPRTPRSVAAIAPAPRKAPAVTVTVFGDRLGQALARGLDDDAGDRFAVSAQTGEEAGLARADLDDWLRGVAGRLQSDRPAVGLVMLGSNDRAALPDGAGMADPFTPRWQSLYTARIDAVATVFRNAQVPLIWVGLPSVHGEDASADFVRLNGLYRDRAAADGVAFVDSWEAFSDDAGAFSPIGPDTEGRMVKLRRADGVGFTRAGARKLASFVEGDIKRLQARPATIEGAPQTADITIEKAREFDSALDIDINAQIQREAALAPNATEPAANPVVTPAPVPQKPAAGPVISLTAAPVSPDGDLATASVSSGSAGLQATLAVKPAETSALPSTPQPGRADDFSWPKP